MKTSFMMAKATLVFPSMRPDSRKLYQTTHYDEILLLAVLKGQKLLLTFFQLTNSSILNY